MRAAAEIKYRKQIDESDVDKAGNLEQALTTVECPSPQKKPKKKYPTPSNFQWCTDQGSSKLHPIFTEPNYSKYRDFSPRKMFEIFFYETLFESIVEQSNLYCQSKNITALAITK